MPSVRQVVTAPLKRIWELQSDCFTGRQALCLAPLPSNC